MKKQAWEAQRNQARQPQVCGSGPRRQVGGKQLSHLGSGGWDGVIFMYTEHLTCVRLVSLSIYSVSFLVTEWMGYPCSYPRPPSPPVLLKDIAVATLLSLLLHQVSF